MLVLAQARLRADACMPITCCQIEYGELALWSTSTQKLSRILIVDDNPSNIFVLEEMLRDSYHVETAESGEEALDIAVDFLPDLVLLDIMMPGIDGYETCRRMRENPIFSGMKIVMVSAKAMKAERLQGYEVGADDYVTKPFDDDELLAKVQVYVRLKAAEDVGHIKSKMYALLIQK
ncbi:hypothetical protein C2W62_27940 [Candidatus Entotheonella serta]|nr:hypothetical protein C2W62_27940 [Candidatus Entotheonella serta]